MSTCNEHGWKPENLECPLCSAEAEIELRKREIAAIRIWADSVSRRLGIPQPPTVYGFGDDGEPIT